MFVESFFKFFQWYFAIKLQDSLIKLNKEKETKNIMHTDHILQV